MRRTFALLAGMLALAGSAAAAPQVSEPAAEIVIAGSRVFPESIGADAAGNIYATSLTGTVYRARPGSKTAEPWITPNSENGLLWTMGVLPDSTSGTLWVCSTPAEFIDPALAGDAALTEFDLASGAFRARYVLPKPEGQGAPPNATCNDIAVSDNGDVYVTDTGAGRLYRLRFGTGSVAVVLSDPLLFGVEGAAFGDDGRLYVNNTTKNSLLRVEFDAAGAETGLTPIATSISLRGADGLRHFRGNSFLQAETGGSGRITLVTVSGDKAQVRILRKGTGSAGVTFVGNTACAAAGKIGYLFDPKLKDQSPEPFTIACFPIDAGA